MSTTATGPLTIGPKWLTQDAEQWRAYFLRKTSISEQDFDAKILDHATQRHSPKIGGNSVLLAAADLGLYQGTAP